jgi:hypothetical protein
MEERWLNHGGEVAQHGGEVAQYGGEVAQLWRRGGSMVVHLTANQ